MSHIQRGRQSAAPGVDGTVLFLIGMRVNRLWQVWRWLPVALAMPRMLAELARDPSLGLVGRPRTLLSGRTVLVWQYWDSFESLDAYARAGDRAHLPAWRVFNRRIKDNGSVGIYHETVLLSEGSVETVYVNMPPIGLGAAVGTVPAGRRGETAGVRLGRRYADTPPVPPY